MFEKIIGNDKIKETLLKIIESKNISHSYMFTGTDGIGKQLIAKEFAKYILCINDDKLNSYCGSCKSCIEIDENNNPDFMLVDILDGEKSIKISQIRNLQLKIAEKPIISSNKVYIINNADTMTQEAQNCLLKTLEEPPTYVTIILVGTNENNFLATIKSRCTKMIFEKLSNDDLKKYVRNKNVEIADNLIKLAGGSICKINHIIENEEAYKKVENIVNQLDSDDIIEILNISDILYSTKEEIFELLDSINILCMEKAKENNKYLNCINVVEETKKRLIQNANYDMSIDNLIFTMWREVN